MQYHRLSPQYRAKSIVLWKMLHVAMTHQDTRSSFSSPLAAQSFRCSSCHCLWRSLVRPLAELLVGVALDQAQPGPQNLAVAHQTAMLLQESAVLLEVSGCCQLLPLLLLQVTGQFLSEQSQRSTRPVTGHQQWILNNSSYSYCATEEELYESRWI